MDHLKKLTGNSIYRLAEASRLMREHCNKKLADIGVRPAQVNALSVLCDQKLSMPSEVARQLGISRPSVTHLLERMERDALIQRMKDQDNMRRIWIVPTPRGRALLKDAQRIYAEIGKEIDALLGADVPAFDAALSLVGDYAAGKSIEKTSSKEEAREGSQTNTTEEATAAGSVKTSSQGDVKTIENRVADKLVARMEAEEARSAAGGSKAAETNTNETS